MSSIKRLAPIKLRDAFGERLQLVLANTSMNFATQPQASAAAVVLDLDNPTIKEIVNILLEAKACADAGALKPISIGKIIRFNALRQQGDKKLPALRARRECKRR